MPKYDFDLFTIGAGSGGVRASRMAGKLGARVAVAEESRVGGTCVMRGCIPKKLLVLGAHFAEDFEDARAYGWSVDGARFDWPQLIRNKNKELDRLEGVYRRVLRENAVTLVEGRARLADAHTVEVDGKRHTAENILIATGGWPSMPALPGIEHAISSNEALDLPRLPKRIAIVGGGYIAVEFAGIFNGLGAGVTEIIRAGTILRGFDEDVREALAEEMRKKGVTIRSDCQVRAIEKTNGRYSVRLAGGDAVEADVVMYATGRAPNTKGMGLEEAGVTLDNKGAVAVDAYSRSSVPNICAIGDVTDRLNLTPVAIAEAMALVQTLFGKTPTAMDYANIATAVFSQPPIGTVGLTEAEARERGPVDVYLSRFKPLKHTLTGRDERTMMKLVVDRKTDRVLGCHMVGADAPEIIQGIAVALKCGATKAQFDATVGIHPTAAEEFVTMREKLPEHGKG
ncbi:MAG: glutathione-disulfide reductase [Rhodospirillales bacterium]|nr:glutathione-disulfide reductase [Rhodospirillales bacterium]